jgi:NAD(P)H-dependent flavin oxidoreductase YrpB (nitropropane dioxygenase family)
MRDDRCVAILERIGVEKPIIQAGMGGGIARHALAAAVSEAGGLGTIAVQGAPAIERELAAARRLTDRPIAVNLILHFARPSWFRAADEADVVVTFWGRPDRRTSGVWFHQAGSVDEARSARAAGADGVIVQGVEAGGHVRGTIPALDLLAQTRAALGRDYPLFLAGGIAERGDVTSAMAAGAHAAVAGTRFLLSPESGAHASYQERLLAADRTILTELFGLAWPAPHRVVPNAATERQLGASGEVPRVNRIVNRMSARTAKHTPDWVLAGLVRRQRPDSHLLTPQSPSDATPDGFVDAGPLYAGETVRRIDSVLPAADIVDALTP